MLSPILVKSILNKHKKRDSWFLDDYSMNPYSSCSFNCLYCYIRGSRYGENLADKLSIKSNAVELLNKQLLFRVKKRQYGIIALSSATDPYLPVEKDQQLTRQCLEIILKHRFPVIIITKSTLVLRDVDLLKRIDEQAILPEDLKKSLKRGAIISFSLSTLDEKISDKLEAGAPKPAERLETLLKMKEQGFLAGVNAIPTLPYLSDSDEQLRAVIKKAKDYRADYILVGGLTLFGSGPADSRTLYYKMLEKNFPELLTKYKQLYRIFFFPPKKYIEDLAKRVKGFCKEYQIRNSIIAE